MAYKPPVAVYDACVLYPFHLRNILIQCAAERLVDARWTDVIHYEWIRNLVANTKTLSFDQVDKTRRLMNAVVPDAMVLGYEQHIPTIDLPDMDDRHVVAAAIAAGASLIITWNVRDFPAKELAKYKIKKQTPDSFLMDIYAVVPDLLVAATSKARQNLRISGISAAEFIGALERQNLHRFVDAMKAHISKL